MSITELVKEIRKISVELSGELNTEGVLQNIEILKKLPQYSVVKMNLD